MDYNEINYDELIKEASENASAFLCGNGFSINFDNDYKLSKLVERLYKTHCHLNQNDTYDIDLNKTYNMVLKENYNATKRILKKINSETAFSLLFSNAVALACSIIENKSALSWLNDNGFNSRLTFGLAHIDLVYSIVEQAKKNGDMYVNYEYWTVLIYYIIALKNIPSEVYSFDENNIFVSAVLAGNTHSLINEPPSGTNIYLDTSTNGMYTYLHFLFSTNILLDGKSFNVTNLSNWDNLYIDKIKLFLLNFDNLMTTNYDRLLEDITKREISHLHGSYFKHKKRVMSQSLGVFYNLVRYDLSTTVIGDYFLSKMFLQITSRIAAKQPQNSDIEVYAQILERIIKEAHSQVIVIFGLNMDNDYHILRDIQIYFEAGRTKTPHIIYCYYSEIDKNSFINAYDACITYSPKLCDFVRNDIKVSILDSKEMIKNVFVPIKT